MMTRLIWLFGDMQSMGNRFGLQKCSHAVATTARMLPSSFIVPHASGWCPDLSGFIIWAMVNNAEFHGIKIQRLTIFGAVCHLK